MTTMAMNTQLSDKFEVLTDKKLCLTGLFCYDVKFKNLFSLKTDKSEGGLLL